jgi:type I restriction enzyme S subunit
LAAVDRARRAAEAQVAAAKALPAAYLRAVFESEEARRWPVVPLGEAGAIGSGITLGRKLNGSLTRPVPYLRVANVKDGFLDLTDVYQIEATEAEAQKYRLQYGDLLLTEGGDPDKLGRGTFWEEQIPNCIHQNHIFRVRFDPAEFSPRFVAAQISSPYGKAYFLSHAKQTTGIATINQRVLAAFPLMVTPFSEQQRIVAMLIEQMTAAEQGCAALKAQLAAVEKLPAALLRRAFSGAVGG